MKILCTFPGRAGDLLWALPTIRALSRRMGEPVDLLICGEFAGLVPLLVRQPYLGLVVAADQWGMSEGWRAPRPVDTESAYDGILDLGYRRWPELPLAQETLYTYNTEYRDQPGLSRAELHLEEPWITHLPPANTLPLETVVGWAETHFEYKVGLCELLAQRLPHPPVLLTHDRQSRWRLETSLPSIVGPWLEEAVAIKAAKVFLGCNSGLHVLAVAVGTPVVLVEPMSARWNDIFYPVGKVGPQVTLVTGNDGQPTTDVRHVADALHHALSR